MRVRAATDRDARAIAQVHVDAWRVAYRGIMPDEYLDGLSVGEREATWRSALADADPELRVWVATEAFDDGVIGFASTGATRDEGAEPGTAELFAIYVDPEQWGNGAGRALLDRATSDLRERGFRRVTLWVLEANAPARRFYERAGWTFDGTRSTHAVECLNLPMARYRLALA